MKTLNQTFNLPLLFAGLLAIAGTYASFEMFESAELFRTKALMPENYVYCAFMTYVYGIAGGCGFITFLAILRKGN